MIYTEVKIPYPPFPSTPLLTIQKTKLAVYSVHITMTTNVSHWWRDTLPFLPYHTTNIARWPPFLNPNPEIYFCVIFTLTKSFLSRKGVRGDLSVLSMASWLFLTRCPALRWTAPTQWPDPPCWTSQTPAFQSSKQGSAPPNQSDPCCSLWRRKRARRHGADTECLIYFSSPTACSLHSFCPPQRGALSRVQARTQETSVDPFSWWSWGLDHNANIKYQVFVAFGQRRNIFHIVSTRGTPKAS